MKVAMIQFEVKPERKSEFVKMVEALWGKVESIPGVVGPIYLVSEPGTNKCFNFGFWETAEQAAAFAKNPELIRFEEEVRPLLLSEPVRKIYDVLGTTSKAGKKAA